MFSKRLATILAATLFVLFTFAGKSAFGDSYEYRYDRRPESERRIYKSGKMISEERQGREVDDWIERGSSSVTESPEFKDGIRLEARANRNSDDYALASAIYLFQIPDGARSIKIKVQYKAKSGRDNFDGDIAGRVWIKSARMADGRGRDYTGERRFEDNDQPLNG